ncbi:MAG: hypothetical protein U1F68_12835 [Gammaproteobacteria bacterium]
MTAPPDRRFGVKDRVEHIKSAAVDAAHRVEHSAVDAYRTVTDHDAQQLRADVNGLLGRWAGWLSLRYQAFWFWYHLQPRFLKLLYGLTISPIALLVLALGFVFVKIGGPILLALALVLKFGAALAKTGLLIGYIVYKIIKLLLIGYYSISRWLSGNKARRRRLELTRCSGFAVRTPAIGSPLSFRCQGKNLYIGRAGAPELRVLFSYWRYAMRGQSALVRHVRQDWSYYLTLWHPTSRALIVSALAPVGASLFAPHKLGAQIAPEHILVPGDAELEQVVVSDDAPLSLHFTIRWVDWRIHWPNTLRFPRVRREQRQERWEVAVAWIPATTVYPQSVVSEAKWRADRC